VAISVVVGHSSEEVSKMASNIITRQFQSNDAESLIALWQEVLPSSQPWNEPREVLRRKMNQHDDLVFVAEKEAKVVGAVMAGYDGIRGWIYSLAVSSEHRRCGIGRQLIEVAESTLRALGCPKVNLQVRSTNLEVLEFYRRCGYAVEDRASLGKSLHGR
jgi:ribosomal protein S18 acetylase RimI-like enzyme